MTSIARNGIEYASTVGRLAARAVAAHVGHDHLEAGVDERGHLLRPQPLRVGEAVHQHDRPALALDLHVERHAVGLDLHRAPRHPATIASSSSRVGAKHRRVAPARAELDDLLEHAGSREHLVGHGRARPRSRRNARSTSPSCAGRGLQRLEHVPLADRPARTPCPRCRRRSRRAGAGRTPAWRGTTARRSACVTSCQPLASAERVVERRDRAGGRAARPRA